MQRKIYAIVKPCGYRLPRFADIGSETCHELFDEKIGEYALGRPVTFHESLEKAKANFISEFRTKKFLENGGYPEKADAIIELIIDDKNKIINFGNIHTIPGYAKHYKADEKKAGYFYKAYEVIWNERAFDLECTSGALAEINKLYNNSNISQQVLSNKAPAAYNNNVCPLRPNGFKFKS